MSKIYWSVETYCIHGHAGLWLNVTVGQQWPLTAGAQDVLRSWWHGLDAVLTKAVLPVKGHPVPSRERSSVGESGWVGGWGEASTVGQQTMSCGPAARASVCAPPCSLRGFDRIRGRGSVSAARSLRRPRSTMKPMWQRERNGRGVIFLIGIFDTDVLILHYIASYCVEVSSTPLSTPVVRLRRFQWGSSQNVSELL